MLKIKKSLVYTLAILMLLMTTTPFIIAVIVSLSPLDAIAQGEIAISEFSLENYKYIITGFPFIRWTINSFIVAIFVTTLNVIINTMVGYSMARHKGMQWLLFIILMCMMIPAQVLLAPTYLLLVKLGMIDTYLGLILPFCFNLFYAFLMKQYLESLPYELEESAYIDGMTQMKAFWKIIVPCAKIPIISQAILIFTFNWNSYMWPSIIATSTEMYTLPVGLSSFYGQYDQFWNQIMAGVVLLTIPTVVIFLVFQKYFTRGIATTGLK